MDQLTHNQHLLLEEMHNNKMDIRKNNSDEDIELIWELVRAGYLNNFPLLGGSTDWRFSLTDKANNYFENIIKK